MSRCSRAALARICTGQRPPLTHGQIRRRPPRRTIVCARRGPTHRQASNVVELIARATEPMLPALLVCYLTPSRSSAAVIPRALAMSKIRSSSMLRRPCSTSIRTFLDTPASRASCSWVKPLWSRARWIRRPTRCRRRSHAATLFGSSWLGRVGTHFSNGVQFSKVCPTSRALFFCDRLLIPRRRSTRVERC